MSFKRVGDDRTAIQVQKKQRVSELLLQDIPEEEATLLKNGRFACLVCKHCPVFDTVAVLSIHRQGKKHLANAKVRLERLREDVELLQKREHVKYLETLENNGTSKEAPLLTVTKEKTKLALQGSPGIGTNKGGNKERKTSNKPFFQPRRSINWYTKAVITNSSPGIADSTLSSARNSASVNKVSIGHSLTNSSAVNNVSCSQLHADMFNTSSSNEKNKVMSPSERAQREYNYRLIQAGWIMGLDGKWCKDENAEFDSDSDEPPPPPE